MAPVFSVQSSDWEARSPACERLLNEVEVEHMMEVITHTTCALHDRCRETIDPFENEISLQIERKIGRIDLQTDLRLG